VVELEFKLSGDVAASIDKFEARIKQQALLSGAAAMARVVYAEVKQRAPTLGKPHWFYGTHARYLLPVDALKNAIYRVYAFDKSDDARKVYKLSWNHKKAPHGFMVEYGTSTAPAHPFLRPGFDASIKQAIEAGNDRIRERLAEGVSL
jgi:hypothetical protein